MSYCTQADIEAIWSANAVLLAADDDQDGQLSTAETEHISQAIERAANMMDASLEMRYQLSDLTGNTWCRDANATLAAYLLACRRGNTPPEHIQEQFDYRLDELADIRAGRRKVPGVSESSDIRPSVSNFDACLGCDDR